MIHIKVGVFWIKKIGFQLILKRQLETEKYIHICNGRLHISPNDGGIYLGTVACVTKGTFEGIDYIYM